MGRLSNPFVALETARQQGLRASTRSALTPPTTPNRSPEGRRGSLSNNVGRLSNPAPESHRGDDRSSPHESVAREDLKQCQGVQRRLNQREIENLVNLYQSGHSLAEIAQSFGVHRQTVASHLARIGIDRRVNVAKLSPSDVQLASALYLTGESLATVGRAMNVDARTIQRAFRQAGTPTRPQRGR